MKPFGRLTTYVLFFFSIFLLDFQVNAQGFVRYTGPFGNFGFGGAQRYSIGLGIGGSTYFGDLCAKVNCIRPRPSAGVGISISATNNLSIQTSFQYVSLSGKDLYFTRDHKFKSNNFEISTTGSLQLFSDQQVLFENRIINPYAFLGIGVLYYNPKGLINDQWVELRALETGGYRYSNYTFIIPFGIGTKLKITDRISLAPEIGFRKTFTDYLDDLSGDHLKAEYKLSVANSSNTTTAGNQQPDRITGNPNRKDWYMLGQVKINFALGTVRPYKR